MIRYFYVNLLSRHFMGVVKENDATFKICMSLQGNILDYLLRIRKTHIKCVWNIVLNPILYMRFRWDILSDTWYACLYIEQYYITMTVFQEKQTHIILKQTRRLYFLSCKNGWHYFTYLWELRNIFLHYLHCYTIIQR